MGIVQGLENIVNAAGNTPDAAVDTLGRSVGQTTSAIDINIPKRTLVKSQLDIFGKGDGQLPKTRTGEPVLIKRPTSIESVTTIESQQGSAEISRQNNERQTILEDYRKKVAEKMRVKEEEIDLDLVDAIVQLHDEHNTGRVNQEIESGDENQSNKARKLAIMEVCRNYVYKKVEREEIAKRKNPSEAAQKAQDVSENFVFGLMEMVEDDTISPELFNIRAKQKIEQSKDGYFAQSFEGVMDFFVNGLVPEVLEAISKS